MSTRLTSTTYSSSRAVVHCDVDCFYCQVETLDNPALIGRPLAVHQGNSGGFVAVNYESEVQARAFGVRCGDGSDPGNLAAKTFQQDRPDGNRSLPEVRQLCPGLVTKPMRSDRYRQVSAQLLALLSTYAANGQCEKTSYDDFYLEVHATSSAITSQQDCSLPTDGAVHVVGDSSFAALPAVLQQAVQVVGSIKAAVKQELGFSMSFGIAEGKLAARLAGPMHKPAGITVVPPHQAARFLLDTPILKIPQLRGQLGKQVTEQLLVEHVRDLSAYDAKTLTELFGESTGQLLHDVAHAVDNKRVQSKAPQQSIACTKSYHGLREMSRVDEALHRLVFALWPRLLEERSKSGRIPIKLKLSCKQGGREEAVRSHTLPFPHAATKQLSATALGSVDPAMVSSAAVHTLIPNLAPRSRFTDAANACDANVQHGLATGEPCWQSHGQPHGGQVGLAEWDESSGPHQDARQAMFDTAMYSLRPKIAQPVLVNFLSLAGEYVKDHQQLQQTAANSMLRFLQKPHPAKRPMSTCEAGQSLPAGGQTQCSGEQADVQVHEQQQADVFGSVQSDRLHACPGMSFSSINGRPSKVIMGKRQRTGPLDNFFKKR